jgi:L-threonylcarbamoyladenylate synthase
MRTSGVPTELFGTIDAAARALLEGGLAIYPTETFYGLGAAVRSAEAVHRLGALKGRATGKPMPVIVADEASARALFLKVPEVAEIFIRRFWPGPLTLVLPARPGLPFEIAPDGEVGVRVSSHPVARELARLAGPLVATSANLAGSQESDRVERIERALRAQVQAVVDAGHTPGGRPSTVLGFADGVPVILREGAIQKALIDACRQ